MARPRLPRGEVVEGHVEEDAVLVLDLEQPRLLTSRVAGKNGSLMFTRDVPPAACGTFLQAVDAVTCTKSNTVAMPEN